MEEKKIGLILDLGNSETRYYIECDGEYEFFRNSNRFAPLNTGYAVPIEYQDNDSTVFKYRGHNFANGKIVDSEFSALAVKPVAIKTKTEQEVSLYAINLIIIDAYRYLSNKLNIPVDQLNVVFDIHMLLPASEHAKYAVTMASKVKDITSVEIVSPVQFVKPVKVVNVKILPEGVSAYSGAMYDINEEGDMIVREENEKFLTGDTLVIDIGAGTTDIVHIRNSKVILASKESFREGGNTVATTFKNLINNQYDYYPSNEAIQGVLDNGILLKGAKEIVADKQLNEAKREFGTKLTNFLIDYTQRHNIELRDLKGLLVVGGGTLPTYRNGNIVSPALASVLITFINDITDSVELIDTGESPRMLNVLGLKLYYQFAN